MSLLRCRILLYCAMALSLAVVGRSGQTTGIGTVSPGAPSPQNVATLAPLAPLIPQLQQAIQAGDIDAAYKLVERLQSGVVTAHRTVYSPSKNLVRMEEAYRERPDLRKSRIAYLAISAAWAKDYIKAKAYASEALSDATPGSSNEAKNRYYGNEVLGLVALNSGDLVSAKQHLLLSATVKGWSEIDRFGPNTALAKALLEKGEREAVLDFLEQCKSLWPSGKQKLDQWQGIIRAGAMPDFSPTPHVLP